MVSLSTFLSDLPPDISFNLETALNKDNLWIKIASSDPGSPYYLRYYSYSVYINVSSTEEVEKCRQIGSNAGKKCLAQWGIRGQTVHGFLSRLQVKIVRFSFIFKFLGCFPISRLRIRPSSTNFKPKIQ